MGLTAVLEREDGEQVERVEDPTNVLHRILPPEGAAGYQCLHHIDWYGNTVFNSLQAPQFLVELNSLQLGPEDAEVRRVVEGIRRLGERVQREVHLYLKFYGD
jgi:hypothetical protein